MSYYINCVLALHKSSKIIKQCGLKLPQLLKIITLIFHTTYIKNTCSFILLLLFYEFMLTQSHIYAPRTCVRNNYFGALCKE